MEFKRDQELNNVERIKLAKHPLEVRQAILERYSKEVWRPAEGGWTCAPLFCGERVVEEVGLDPALITHALLTLGHAEEDLRRRSRKSLDELVVHRDAKQL